MKNLIKLTVFFAVIAILSACGGGTDSTNDSEKDFIINWEFEEVGKTEFDAPITKVIMNVDGKDIILTENLEFSCSTLSDEDYALYKMPDKVLSGFTAWWAGGGYYFYVTLEHDKLVVMRAITDEMLSLDDLLYETFKEIPVSEL